MKMNPFVAAQIAEAIGEQMKRSYETALKYKAAGDAAKEVFTAPPPASTTASAGGSTTSAA